MVKGVILACAFACAMVANAVAATSVNVVTASNLSDPPTLRCRPQTLEHLSECAIFLPAGENINPDKIISDDKRWLLTPERLGPAGAIGEQLQWVVFVKETSDAAGISTVAYLLTDAPHGAYRILIVSDPNAPIFSEVHFQHALTMRERNEMISRRREAIAAAQAQRLTIAALAQQRANAEQGLKSLESHPCTVRQDTRYTWHPDLSTKGFSPVAVFLDDENHTCVQFDERIQQLPTAYTNGIPIRFHTRRGDNMMILDGLQGHFQLKIDSRLLNIDYAAKN